MRDTACTSARSGPVICPASTKDTPSSTSTIRSPRSSAKFCTVLVASSMLVDETTTFAKPTAKPELVSIGAR
jgi:hypothetical protein